MSNLINGFVLSAEKYPDNNALFVDGKYYSYRELGRYVMGTQNLLDRSDSGGCLIGIYAYRSLAMYTAILSILYKGKGYVPLNPILPPKKNTDILLKSGVKTLLTESARLEGLLEILPKESGAFTIIVLDKDNVDFEAFPKKHNILCVDKIGSDTEGERLSRRTVKKQLCDISYLLFTSGSTGEPKGIAVKHRHILHLIKVMTSKYGFGPDDRFIQNADYSFDFSVAEIFLSLASGGCLYCTPKSQCMIPASFVSKHKITVWTSVPSVIDFLSKFNSLKSNYFSSLRYAFFCGEPLTAAMAEDFLHAAPEAKIINLYGPTEAAVFFTAYEFNSNSSTYPNGIVPIGKPFESLNVEVIGKEGQPVENGNVGELYLSGPQVVSSYWCDQELSRERFVETCWPNQDKVVWYKTGDLVKSDHNGDLIFIGRTDDQLQIAGYRVELGEIEYVLRTFADVDRVVALGYSEDAEQDYIIIFYDGKCIDRNILKSACVANLPSYMVPKEFHYIDSLPVNQNGKIDKRKLADWRRSMHRKDRDKVEDGD
jgi:amino acid adenylation domain-containing protein|tara:strand:- start:2183 stop:3802 length:1620 start_codon:yes stop_codon:yes gene_type:complete